MRFSSRVVSRRAFTLVQLLSVIGIMDFLGPLLTVTSNEYPEATPVSYGRIHFVEPVFYT